MSVHSNTNPDSQPTSLCSNFLMQCPANTDFIVLVGHEGRIQDFKLEGAHLKKLHRAEGGAKIVGVIRVKNHDFTPKNHIFSNCGGRRENFWGISCEKSRFHANKIIFFPILGGAPPPWIRPWTRPATIYQGGHLNITPPMNLSLFWPDSRFSWLCLFEAKTPTIT
jgi:hypothetical protein